MVTKNRFSTVGKVLYAQALVSVVVAIAFWYAGGEWTFVVSPLAGSLIAFVPNLFFAFRIYLARNATAHDAVNAFYTGEVVKLLMTAALFVLALQLPHVNFKTLLVGYVAVLSVFWFALFYWRD